MEYTVKILSVKDVTHDVKSFKVERPPDYHFIPGQATELSINKPAWENEKRPFTFTSLADQPFLEFTIKCYADHKGVTNELSKLKEDDELIVRDVWGAIEYKGPGYFIAGGAGITPFIAILRQLQKENKLADNKLLFSNKTAEDIILNKEFSEMLGGNFINTLTDRKEEGYLFGMINKEFLSEHVTDFQRRFYLCGPPPMVETLQSILSQLGALPESVVFEK